VGPSNLPHFGPRVEEDDICELPSRSLGFHPHLQVDLPLPKIFYIYIFRVSVVQQIEFILAAWLEKCKNNR
jgi:hypothetical protein